MIQGSASNIVLKGTPKFAHLHVSRLDKDTTQEVVLQYLRTSGFSTAECEKVISKYPDRYSSFKISVPFAQLNEVKKPDLWPSGACINPFLWHIQNKKKNR